MTLIDAVRKAGLLHNFEIIHLFEGGSKLHGARVEGKNDLDIYGIFIEPKNNALGLDPHEHFVTSTSDEQRRNTPDDVDITLYSLRRWAMLATKGNPTALNFLFAPTHPELNTEWRWIRPGLSKAILARSAAGHFRGFVEGQMKRLLGQGTGKHGQRPDLVNDFGYDTKAGMHAVRLLGEGTELMHTGTVTFPRPNTEELIAVRNGKYSLDQLCSRVSVMIGDLENAYITSPLPPKPDRQAVSRILAETYLDYYTENR